VGHLVGSIGEVNAAEALDPELYGGMIVLSASDLTGHLHCRHLTALDVEVATGARPKPKVWDPVLELLAERGALHEASYVEHLRTGGSVVAHVSGKGVDSASVSETLNAMRSGVSVIVQGALQVGQWSGRADVLRRVETPSGLGPWSYEVIDTKLARETKGSTVLQVSLYSDLLGSLQERVPEFAYVVVPETGYEPQAFRIADYAAYYRRVRRSLEQSVGTAAAVETYPEPNPHCEVCRWRVHRPTITFLSLQEYRKPR
jgi:predicted RecB family nuclease